MKKQLGGILSILLLTLTTLGFAQGTGSGSSDPATARDPNQATNQTNGTQDNRGGHDWGWIGLLGLAGLAGLAGRRNNRDRQVTDHDRNVSDIRRAA